MSCHIAAAGFIPARAGGAAITVRGVQTSSDTAIVPVCAATAAPLAIADSVHV
jgi:hypothetical protein